MATSTLPLTKREQFALAATTGLCSGLGNLPGKFKRKEIVAAATELADELIAHLETTDLTKPADVPQVTDESGSEDPVHRMD